MIVYKMSEVLAKEVESGKFANLQNEIQNAGADTLNIFKQRINLRLAKNLAICLQEMPAIHSVQIDYCNIEKGAENVFAKNLAKTNVTEVDFGCNATFGCNAAFRETACHVVKDLPSQVTKINLKFNYIGKVENAEKNLRALFSSLKDTVTSLDLSLNQINDDLAKKLVPLIQAKKNLQYCNLDANDNISDGVLNKIQSILQARQTASPEDVNFSLKGNQTKIKRR